MAVNDDSSYEDEPPSETYEPTFYKPKGQDIQISDDEEDDEGTYQDLP